jgi:hypothetical protein
MRGDAMDGSETTISVIDIIERVFTLFKPLGRFDMVGGISFASQRVMSSSRSVGSSRVSPISGSVRKWAGRHDALLL